MRKLYPGEIYRKIIHYVWYIVFLRRAIDWSIQASYRAVCGSIYYTGLTLKCAYFVKFLSGKNCRRIQRGNCRWQQRYFSSGLNVRELNVTFLSKERGISPMIGEYSGIFSEEFLLHCSVLCLIDFDVKQAVSSETVLSPWQLINNPLKLTWQPSSLTYFFYDSATLILRLLTV